MECNSGDVVEIISIGLTSTASLISNDRFENQGRSVGLLCWKLKVWYHETPPEYEVDIL